MRPTKETGIPTVAAVRAPREKGPVELFFNERQQIFALPSEGRLADGLREAADRGTPAGRAQSPPRHGVRLCVPLSERELREFEKARILLDAPSGRLEGRPRADRPDDVQHRRLLPEGPDLQVLHEDDPELQGREGHLRLLCGPRHLLKLYAILHCIPFQHARDGC